MTRSPALYPLLFLALAFAPSAARAQQGSGLSEADRAAIDRLREAYVRATLAGDWAAVAALYDEEAVWLPPSAPGVRNRPTIQANLEAETGRYVDLSIVPVEVKGMGDLAYGWGTYFAIRSVGETAEQVRDAGKYLVVLERQRSGSWLISRHIWNSDLKPSR